MADTGISGAWVARALEALVRRCGKPTRIVSELPMDAPQVRAPLATAPSFPAGRF